MKSIQNDEIKKLKLENEEKIQVLQEIVKELENNMNSLLEENKHKTEALIEGNNKNNYYKNMIDQFKTEKQKVIEEYKNKIESIVSEKKGLWDECIDKIEKKDKELINKISELRIVNKELLTKKHELEIYKSKNDKWETSVKNKIDDLVIEKQKMQEKVLKTKTKYKNKIIFLKNVNDKKLEDLIRENTIRIKKYELERSHSSISQSI